jgi:hypothetical protein
MKNALFNDSIYKNFTATAPTDEVGFFSDSDVFEKIINAIKPKTIIEIGSWKGHSAIAMANMCKDIGIFSNIICVDTWLGSNEHWLTTKYRSKLNIAHGRPQFYSEFLSNVINAQCESYITPLCLPSATAAIVLKAFDIAAEMIYIDGAHEYDDVLGDIGNFMDLMAFGGVIFGDDYQYEPLRRAVHAFARGNGTKVYVSGRKWLYAGDRFKDLGIGELKPS